MKTSDFSFQLPDRLIADYPAENRSDSRMLCLHRDDGGISHRHVYDLPDLLRPNDLLVFNDTRVIPARLFGFKQSGGKLEALVERVISDTQMLVQIRASKAPKVDSQIFFGDPDQHSQPATVMSKEGGFYLLSVDDSVANVLESYGHMPLPPYIKRSDKAVDMERYQTVYAQNKGAVAAPTAGLHFDTSLLAKLESKGVQSAFLTLHVGAGTFQPIRVEDPTQHQMHKEWLNVTQELCDKVVQCKAKGGRVVAVGTTSVRSLESAAKQGRLAPYQGETDIFIYGDYNFKVVDALLTNFHLPESTLLMLVSAFAGKQRVLNAYETAVTEEYRFFSYGDAMFISC